MNNINPYNTPESRFIKKLKESCEKNNLVPNEDKIIGFLNCRFKYQYKIEEKNINESIGNIISNSNNIDIKDNLLSSNSKKFFFKF